MKRSIVTLLTALALTCALCLPAGAETLAELRQETAGGWHRDFDGQKRSVGRYRRGNRHSARGGGGLRPPGQPRAAGTGKQTGNL